MLKVDEYAEKMATERFGLPPCLHVPIAARDEATVRAYVGNVCKVISPGTPSRALLVEIAQQPKINTKLPIWSIPEAAVLRFPKQLWVHVDYNDYRVAYEKAFPNRDI